MKKVVLIAALAICASVLYQCKSTQKTAAATPTPENTLAAAQKRWPDATAQQIAEGQTIYTTKCIRCHSAKSVDSEPEEEWGPIMDRMAPKAKLTAQENENVKRYVLATRDVLVAKK